MNYFWPARVSAPHDYWQLATIFTILSFRLRSPQFWSKTKLFQRDFECVWPTLPDQQDLLNRNYCSVIQ